MAKNRKVLRVGTPLRLSSLLTLLNTIDKDIEVDAIVSHYNGELVVEVPDLTLEGGNRPRLARGVLPRRVGASRRRIQRPRPGSTYSRDRE